MQSINISEFRANLLKYLEIANAGEQITVTSNGRLLATIAPPAQQQKLARQQLQALAERAQVGNITDPIDVSWDAQA